eukprot:scaffold13153_cov72-Phaeocystis_antarctica.AAC.4
MPLAHAFDPLRGQRAHDGAVVDARGGAHHRQHIEFVQAAILATTPFFCLATFRRRAQEDRRRRRDVVLLPPPPSARLDDAVGVPRHT